MSGRRLVFVDRLEDAEPEVATDDIVVLDTSWTPGRDADARILPIRPLLWPILERVDLFEESLERLDQWAADIDLASRFALDGTSWWFHARNFLRLDVHELLLWRRVLAGLAPAGRYDAVSVPAGRPNLFAAVRAAAAGDAAPGDEVGAEPPAVLDLVRRVTARVRRRAGRVSDAVLYPRRRALLADRLSTLAADPPDVLAIIRAGSYHTVDEEAGVRRRDPYLAPVLEAIRADGRSVASVAIGLDYRLDEDWEEIERDAGLIPQGILREHFGLAEDKDLQVAARTRLGQIEVPRIEVDGADLGPAIHALVASQGGWLDRQWRTMLLARRLMAAIQVGVLFTGWEAARTAWVGAARSLAIPSVAVQHGVIYPHSPDYYRPLHPALVRPDITCVFGPYERDVLVDHGRYAPATVVVTGSPRVDPAQVLTPASPDERVAVRAELGVRDGDRLLVISAARAIVGDAIHSVTAMARLLDGPLPGTHVVFKLHPEEEDGNHYESLIRGLAVAGGYDVPPVTVIRDIDVYRLLRAADAHLGQYSTVLTDAVLTNTPNMVSVGHAWADIIGYVDAGVASPVKSVEDVRAFMHRPRRPSEQQRERFVQAHYRPGNAIGRIAGAIVDAGGHGPSDAS